jgi:hypothetical protein
MRSKEEFRGGCEKRGLLHKPQGLSLHSLLPFMVLSCLGLGGGVWEHKVMESG